MKEEGRTHNIAFEIKIFKDES